MLELRSGKKIDDLLQSRLAEPLGLTDTDYRASDLPGYAQRARGHAGDQPKFIRRGQPVPDWQFTDILHGTAALYSNVDDLLSYAAANLNGTGNPRMDAALQDTLQVRVDRPSEAAAVAWIVSTTPPWWCYRTASTGATTLAIVCCNGWAALPTHSLASGRTVGCAVRTGAIEVGRGAHGAPYMWPCKAAASRVTCSTKASANGARWSLRTTSHTALVAPSSSRVR